jgi:transcriptional regulator with XRE-family HTH domain
MPSNSLPHYLRTYRRRSALSQGQLAWLLGCQAGSKVSRYERFARTPNLQTVFAYEIIFRTPARELFAGTFAAVAHATLKRVDSLTVRLRHQAPNRLVTAQLAALEAIAPHRRKHTRRP